MKTEKFEDNSTLVDDVVFIQHRGSDGSYLHNHQECHHCGKPSTYLYQIDTMIDFSLICKTCLLNMVDKLNQITLADCRNEFNLYPNKE